MTVYILLRNYHEEGHQILSIWSSLEEALKESESEERRYNLHIEEWEIGVSRCEGDKELWPKIREVQA